MFALSLNSLVALTYFLIRVLVAASIMYASPMYMHILILHVCSEYHFLTVTTQLQSIVKAIYETSPIVKKNFSKFTFSATLSSLTIPYYV